MRSLLNLKNQSGDLKVNVADAFAACCIDLCDMKSSHKSFSSLPHLCGIACMTESKASMIVCKVVVYVSQKTEDKTKSWVHYMYVNWPAVKQINLLTSYKNACDHSVLVLLILAM